MRLLILGLCFFSSIALSSINPFALLSPQAARDDFIPSLLPTDSDCLQRPDFRGASPVAAQINGVYYAYLNKCYWEAYQDMKVQDFWGASRVVIAMWRPVESLPKNIDSDAAACRKKDPIRDVHFSELWLKEGETSVYANYQGCLYYAYCVGGCSQLEDYVDTFYPVAERNKEHPESEIVKVVPSPEPVIEPGFVQEAPPNTLSVGRYVKAGELFLYFTQVRQDYCYYLQSKGEDIDCNSDIPVVRMPELNELPLSKLSFSQSKLYYCYVKSLRFPELAENTCFLNDNLYSNGMTAGQCNLYTDNERCNLYRGISSIGSRPVAENMETLVRHSEASLKQQKEMYSALYHMGKAVDKTEFHLDSIRDNTMRSSNSQHEMTRITADILTQLKQGTGGNYHGDFARLNSDMNNNHKAMLEAMGSGENNESKMAGLQQQFDEKLNEYGASSAQDITQNLDNLFENMPDFFVKFELPSRFYGQSQYSGSCLPIKQEYTLKFPHNMQYAFLFDTTVACEYYDGYFRGVVEFFLYVLTGLACYRLYNRFMLSYY